MTRLPLRRGSWTVQELERLRLLLPQRGVEQTATLLRRSSVSVQKKAIELLRIAPRSGPWTALDDRRLRQAWGAVEAPVLALLIGRRPAEIRARVEELRANLQGGPWTQAERQQLKKLYGTRRDEDLEVCLLRPRDELARVAAQLCLAKDKRFVAASAEPGSPNARGANPRGAKARGAAPRGTTLRSAGDAAHDGSDTGVRLTMRRWTSEEVARLRELYPDHDNLSVARSLGRSVTSVANKAWQLRLHKSPGLLAEIGRSNVESRYRSGGGEAQA